MEPIKQNGPGMYLVIAQIGCFFRAACNMAEREARRQGRVVWCLTAEQLNRIWTISHNLHYINDKENVVVSAPIANLALGTLGIPGKFTEVGTFTNPGEINWYSSLAVKDRRADYFIQKIAQNGPSKTHFRNVNENNIKLWDPHEPDINVQGKYYTICYRYDKGGKNA